MIHEKIYIYYTDILVMTNYILQVMRCTEKDKFPSADGIRIDSFIEISEEFLKMLALVISKYLPMSEVSDD